VFLGDSFKIEFPLSAAETLALSQNTLLIPANNSKPAANSNPRMHTFYLSLLPKKLAVIPDATFPEAMLR
jgi:hypothetical protein